MSDIPIARRDVILHRLDRGLPVVAADLALEFGVSEAAIRRDLRALAAEGRCRRVYGGALPTSPASAPMVVRVDEARERKQALARVGASLVQPGQLVFLDSGSTNLAVVPCLPAGSGITVATNSIAIAAEVARREDLQLLMVGGFVDRHVGGSVDAAAIAMVSSLNVDHCFMGACAVSSVTGVSAFSMADALFKKALALAGHHTVILATSEKLETRAPYRICAVGEIDHLVVEHDAPDEPVRLLAQCETTVLRAAAPP
ncbi:DeoR/GlpR family DNA-binding transcription regulator [Pseudoduganella lutea]|uniref:DeoR/GlpR transcriptional regulator n=1 Tax=Pseudoduganella lutea TaxID=321985 RepID=A0A4P6KTE2_9BURK|nr:DeoR/GlpR family DNA-binding transcription regulator [Pseudoduganella lutea]QBE61805.1 DeoR/GlpR transcriptional regulator [Pseudoduganella lutea]